MAEPTRGEVDGVRGPVVLEFGASWCPHCRVIQDTMRGLLARHPEVRHIPVEDGPGRPLGRSFRVKLWPTLVFLRDGEVRAVAVRPPADQIARSKHLQGLIELDVSHNKLKRAAALLDGERLPKLAALGISGNDIKPAARAALHRVRAWLV